MPFMTDSIEHNQNFDLKENNQKTQPLSLGFLYVFFPLFPSLVLLFEH
ncbi:hypothetical protein [Vibrio vulnificus YJ016]|uniref:Uncharacterized protein n=1 Tax=Vibrio vulnificus (strain YJ016) TaxID=196600 RepID=Q7MNC9_VIBVY|nr:hypothetical protein [Vibrio vulnificus YJ016]